MSDDINNKDDFAEFKPDQSEQESDDSNSPKDSNDVDDTGHQETVNDNAGPIDSNLHNEETPEPVSEKPCHSHSVINDDNKVLCAVSHIGNILAPFTLISGFLSLIIYFVKKEDETVRFHAKQGLIVNLLWIAINIVISIPLFIVSAFCCITFPLILVPWFTLAGFSIYATVKVFQGHNYRLPIVADWADNLNF